jgi:hypothetical protein
LALAILIAQLLFIGGLERTEDKVSRFTNKGRHQEMLQCVEWQNMIVLPDRIYSESKRVGVNH